MTQQRRFSQLDVFTAVPLLGNPLAVVHDGTRPERCADGCLRQLDASVGDDVPVAAHAAPKQTIAFASSRPSASCRSPAIRPSAAATRGSRPAVWHGATARWCRSAAPAWCASAATALDWRLPHRRCAAAGRSSPELLERIERGLGVGTRRDPRSPVGRQRPRLVRGASGLGRACAAAQGRLRPAARPESRRRGAACGAAAATRSSRCAR